MNFLPLSIKTITWHNEFKEIKINGNLNYFYSTIISLEAIKIFLSELEANNNYVCLISIITDCNDMNPSDINKFISEEFLINWLSSPELILELIIQNNKNWIDYKSFYLIHFSKIVDIK